MPSFVKLIFYVILISSLLHGEMGMCSDSTSFSNTKLNYPLFEMSGGLGLVWLFQLNTAISPLPHVYLQPRLSYAIIAYEGGFVIGYQTQYKDNTILRLGVGYSKGKAVPFGPSNSREDTWESLYLRFGVLRRFKENMIINPNLNITRLGGRAILSGNVAIGYCIFR